MFKNKILKYLLLFNTFFLYSWLIYYYLSIAEWHWYIIPIVVVAWFSADFILGMTHLYLDYVQCPSKIGLKDLSEHPNRSSDSYLALKQKLMKKLTFIERVAFDFKTHHLHPKALGNRTFFVLVAETLMTHVMPVLLFLTIGVYFNILNEFVILYFLILSIGFLFGQYAHANTHKENIPFPVKSLQAMHIFLNLERHALHHNTFRQSFCILNGWADYFVDFFAQYMLDKGWLKSENLELD